MFEAPELGSGIQTAVERRCVVLMKVGEAMSDKRWHAFLLCLDACGSVPVAVNAPRPMTSLRASEKTPEDGCV